MRIFAVVAAITVALDQLSKWLAVRFLLGAEPVVLIPNLLQLIYRENTGAAFSMFEGRTAGLAIFSAVVAAAIAIWAARLRPEERELRWPLGLILGGAIGNLIDRFALGYVIDFIDAHWKDVYHWPTFNVADSAICVGMALLIWMSFTGDARTAEAGDAKQETE